MLEAASSRAREVARVVSEASSDGSRAISEQYERVRENAEDERRRTAEAMRAIYDQSAGDTHALFKEANDRFAEVLAGMKQMSTEMQRELETTRNELRRGIFDLPQETAESAAQMRRVIVDQIEALAELNRIVARHGRNLDAVEPMRRPSREEPTLAIVGGRAEAAPARSEPPPRPAPPRNDGANFAPAARRSETPSLSSGAADRPAAAGSPICSTAPRAKKSEPAREVAARKPSAKPRATAATSARRGTPSNRWIRSRSISRA